VGGGGKADDDERLIEERKNHKCKNGSATTCCTSSTSLHLYWLCFGPVGGCVSVRCRPARCREVAGITSFFFLASSCSPFTTTQPRTQPTPNPHPTHRHTERAWDAPDPVRKPRRRRRPRPQGRRLRVALGLLPRAAETRWKTPSGRHRSSLARSASTTLRLRPAHARGRLLVVVVRESRRRTMVGSGSVLPLARPLPPLLPLRRRTRRMRTMSPPSCTFRG